MKTYRCDARDLAATYLQESFMALLSAHGRGEVSEDELISVASTLFPTMNGLRSRAFNEDLGLDPSLESSKHERRRMERRSR